ncbi:protein phosphatase [Bacillus coahuilensis m2-6]|uniref:Stp1/IreP family PP2C-type Ser/Thr phosphatase n=1 Tax=Bacillus coahuilensis TaxID=408580 RepID=UPI0007505B00|nr:Stp1/IreP family PP2C-type Ser/Thr phosphatase [Bacillus coahuilensis]KUP08622.1 protein phosphatase [Bacillus coahuilensis m2-6]
MRTVYQTHVGQVRSHNEDHVGVFQNQKGVHLAIVADGMGGHRAGDVASEMTVEFLAKEWQETIHFETPTDAENWLLETIKGANHRVYEHSLQNSECEGMGTTIVAAICTEQFISLAHVGDSRAYLQNDMGLNQLTNDHSLVSELVRSGEISEEEAEHHPRKNVLLRALGTDVSVEIDCRTIVVEEYDILLLCSDGLSNKLSNDDMSAILNSEESLESKSEQFIRLANAAGGEDNISVVLVNY